jgi:hypothetical protein
VKPKTKRWPKPQPTQRPHWRVAGLMQRASHIPRVMNIRIPAAVANAVEQLASDLNATKTDVIVALLKAGLRITETKLRGFRIGAKR